MRYAIITNQGSTYAPDGSCIENVQILAYIEASSPKEAIPIFEKEHLPDLQKMGFSEYSCFPSK